MSFHLAAYFGTIATSGTRQVLPPVTDMWFPSVGNGFVLPSELKVVAAYATSPAVGTGNVSTTSTTSTPVSGLQNARITAPSLLRVAYPYIRPISNNFGENTDPNVMNLVYRPLCVPASETVGIEVVSGLPGQTPASPNVAAALLWFCDHLLPAPHGEHFTLRFAVGPASSSASPPPPPPTVRGVWSPVGTVTFDQSLPSGAYAVVGFEHWSPTAIAARLVFPGMNMRPGTLSTAAQGSGTNFQSNLRPERLFFEGGIGVYGIFNSFAPPSIEVLAGGADTTHEAYLTVVRLGDINTNLRHHGSHGPGAPGAPGAPDGHPAGGYPPGGSAFFGGHAASGMGHHHGPHHPGAHHQGTHHQGAHHPGANPSDPHHTF